MPDWLIFGVMSALQLFGIYASITFYQRRRSAIGAVRWVWLTLVSLIGGCIGFTAHFTTLLSIPPGDQLVWDPAWTMVSFCIGSSVLFVAISLSERTRRFSRLTFGVVFAAMVSVGNIGMVLTADIQGTVRMDPQGVALSVFAILLLALIGAFATERAQHIRPAALAATALGFAAPVQDLILLSSLRVEFDPAAPVPVGLSQDQTLVALMMIVGGLIAILGGAGLALERVMERDALQRYRKLAYTDGLTGLMNRAGFSEALEAALKHIEETDRALVLIALDLDRFKPINDLYGHRFGDQTLQTIGARVKEVCLRREKIGRVGGDEFLAFKVLPIDDEDAVCEQGLQFAERLSAAITETVLIEGVSVAVGTSMGLSLSPFHGWDRDGLIQCADLALYHAKCGKGRISVYEDNMGEATQRRARLSLELRQALQQEEFELYFQPQVNLRARRPVGFEALIRWNHPERGLIMPGDFIPIAEESHLIAELGAWVLDRACMIAAQWDGEYRVSVNVAPPQLAQPDFANSVRETLDKHGLPAHRLVIELTEASMIIDTDHARHILTELKRVGVRIAMDDYGTGYASLSMLKTFPFDKLKIDKSFVRVLSEDPEALAIVRSTLVLTRALRIPVVAEGAETKEHVDFLIAEGCDEVQGFYFGEPLRESEVLDLIAEDLADDGAKSA